MLAAPEAARKNVINFCRFEWKGSGSWSALINYAALWNWISNWATNSFWKAFQGPSIRVQQIVIYVISTQPNRFSLTNLAAIRFAYISIRKGQPHEGYAPNVTHTLLFMFMLMLSIPLGVLRLDTLQKIAVLIGYTYVHIYEKLALQRFLPVHMDNGRDWETNSPLDLGHQDLGGVLECLHAGATQLADLLPELGAILGLADVYQHIPEQCHMAVDLHDELESDGAKEVNERFISGSSAATDA